MAETELPLSDREFARIRARARAAAGISLSEAKRSMVVSRLSPLVRAGGCGSFDAYLDRLEERRVPEDAQDFINALTTNLTRFYREEHHFDHLLGHVGELIVRRPRMSPDGRPRLRIWSAGCSTGQEPYTIALCLLGAYPELRRWDFRILATDIDTDVLARAAGGTYSEMELAELSPSRLRGFERQGGGMMRVPTQARDLVAFKPLNLMEPSWPMRGVFDAVFCRNVAIYFDKPTQASLFGRLAGVLAPGGYLYIGHSEIVGADVEDLRFVGKTIYQQRSGARARKAA